MFRLPVIHLAAALLAVLPLAAQAQTVADSVMRTTTVTTTTTTVLKPASGENPGPPVTTSRTTSTTTTEAITSPRQPSYGDVSGARPKATATRPAPVASAKAPAKAAPVPRRTATTAVAPAAAKAKKTADPELADMIKEDVDLARATPDQLNSIYERFIEATRAERRQWTSAQWETASAVLSRLNQRYDQVRGDIALEDKLNIRTIQGEFHGLKTARQVSKSL